MTAGALSARRPGPRSSSSASATPNLARLSAGCRSCAANGCSTTKPRSGSRSCCNRLTARPCLPALLREEVPKASTRPALERNDLMTPQDMESRIVRYGDLQTLPHGLHRRPHAGQRPEGKLHHHRRRRVRKPAPARPHPRDPGLQHRRRRPAAEVPQLAAQPHHGGGVLRAEGQLAVLLGALGHGGRFRGRRRATSSTSPPASSAASRMSAPTTG